jgi:hypothetical protein
MSYANDSNLQYDPSESNSSDQRKLNIGYFLFALAALALACSSMSLVHSDSPPNCAYTAMGDVTGNCH